MMRMVKFLAITAALLASTPAAAQGHEHGQGAQQPAAGMGMPMMMPMEMMATTPAMLLRMRQQLGLTADQAGRLEALQRSTEAAHQQHMSAAMQPMRDANAILQGDHPDFNRYEAAVRQAAEHHVAAHVAMARAAVDGRAVLTGEQRARLHGAMDSMMPMMQQMMRDRGCPGMDGRGTGGAQPPAHPDQRIPSGSR